MFDDLFDTRISICSSCLRPIVHTLDAKYFVCLCTMVKETSRQHQKQRLDLDRNCGVIISSTGLPCLRSLTCKSHSLTSKRKVQGRSKPFDMLLRERNALLGKKTPDQNNESTSKSIGFIHKLLSLDHINKSITGAMDFPAEEKCIKRQLKHYLRRPLTDLA